VSLFEKYAKDAIRVVTLCPTFVRVLRVAEFSGRKRVLQTEYLDEDGLMLLETLVTYDGYYAILIEREWVGGDSYDDWKWHPRDYEFPVGCNVLLRRPTYA